MKPLTRDITLTLIVKLILLFALWWVCVRGMHPVLQTSQEWLLGKIDSSVPDTNFIKLRKYEFPRLDRGIQDSHSESGFLYPVVKPREFDLSLALFPDVLHNKR